MPLQRMQVMIAPDEHGPKFRLVLMTLSPSGMNCEVIAMHDKYGFADFWATCFNIGTHTVLQVKEGMSKGLAGVPQDQESRSQHMEARYDVGGKNMSERSAVEQRREADRNSDG